MSVAIEWWMGGGKHLTCSVGIASLSLVRRYLFKTEKIWLLSIWNLRIRSTTFFSCWEKQEHIKYSNKAILHKKDSTEEGKDTMRYLCLALWFHWTKKLNGYKNLLSQVPFGTDGFKGLISREQLLHTSTFPFFHPTKKKLGLFSCAASTLLFQSQNQSHALAPPYLTRLAFIIYWPSSRPVFASKS